LRLVCYGAMVGWEIVLGALGGLALGSGLAAFFSRQKERRWSRQQVELEARLRRVVVPVLERRADVLGIPPAERGADVDGPVELAITLGRAIAAAEESGELPFGDTVEVSRQELDGELAKRGRA
jgi:hypothetical protein